MSTGAAGEEGGRDEGQSSRSGAGGSRAARAGCAWLSAVQAPGSPSRLWFSARPFLPPKGGGESLARRRLPGGLSPSSPGAAGPVSPNKPAPRARAQPRTSALTAAKTESARPDPRGGHRAGVGGRQGDGKTGGLTCAAASSASWSGPGPTWASSCRWTRRPRSLQSGRRRAAAAGARRAALGVTGGPEPGVPAHPSPRGAAGTRSASQGSLLRGRPQP